MTEEPNAHSYEDFYKTLAGYVKEEGWLKLTCYLTLDKHGEVVIFDPQLFQEQPEPQ